MCVIFETMVVGWGVGGLGTLTIGVVAQTVLTEVVVRTCHKTNYYIYIFINL